MKRATEIAEEGFVRLLEIARVGMTETELAVELNCYAKSLGAPFIFLTNGELIYFWDYLNDDAHIVNSFFSRRDLERLVEMRSTRKPLATIAPVLPARVA